MKTITIHGKHGAIYRASAWQGAADGCVHWELLVDRLGGGTECVQRGHTHESVSHALENARAMVAHLDHMPPSSDDASSYM